MLVEKPEDRSRRQAAVYLHETKRRRVWRKIRKWLLFSIELAVVSVAGWSLGYWVGVAL